MRVKLALIILSLALSTMVYRQALLIAPLHNDNINTFLSFELAEPFFIVESDYIGRMDLGKHWNPRIFSRYLGGLAVRHCIENKKVNLIDFSRRVSLWTALWFLAVCGLFVISFKKQALLYITGTYCAISFGYMPGVVLRIFPWDMPALFFFSLFICLMHKNRALLFLLVLPVAVLFKESVLCIIIAYFFLFPNKKFLYRAGIFTLGLLFSLFPKLTADYYTGSFGRPLFNPVLIKSNFLFLSRNIMPYFANAGLVLAAVILPAKKPYGTALRSIMALFLFSICTNAVIFEYRTFFELIPVCIYILCNSFLNSYPEPETAA